MKTAWMIVPAAMAAGMLCLAGCHEHGHAVVVHEQHPVYVQEGPPPPPPAPAPIYLQEAPPPPPVVVMPPPPGPTYVWIPGFYVWESHHYVWRHGHYERPPRHGAVYDHDRWEHTERGYQFHPGSWRDQDNRDGAPRGGEPGQGGNQGRGGDHGQPPPGRERGDRDRDRDRD